MKQLGATKTGGLGYGVSASSSASVKTFQNYAAPAQGLEPVYTNTSVDFGTADVGPLVLGIKNAGADAIYLPMVASTDLAIVQGLEQSGVTMKANLLATGYGQDLLDSPVASTLKDNTVFFQSYKPVELKDKATKQFQADLKKYSGLDGVPDYGQYTGYLAGELARRRLCVPKARGVGGRRRSSGRLGGGNGLVFEPE
jgi:Periplasmic binding protein